MSTITIAAPAAVPSTLYKRETRLQGYKVRTLPSGSDEHALGALGPMPHPGTPSVRGWSPLYASDSSSALRTWARVPHAPRHLPFHWAQGAQGSKPTSDSEPEGTSRSVLQAAEMPADAATHATGSMWTHTAVTRQSTRSWAPPRAHRPPHARGPASCPQSAACQASRGAGGWGQAHEAAGGGWRGPGPVSPDLSAAQ